MADLTSLAAVKGWLSLTTTDNDVLLKRLITQLSGVALNDLQRPCLTRRTYTETRSGVGNQRMVLRNWPVLSVASLVIDGQTIPAAANSTSAGFTLETWDGTSSGNPQEVSLHGYRFCRGLNNVTFVYDAGYCLTKQPYTVGSSSPHVVSFTPAYGSWAQDDGITYANGTALAPVTGSPSVGQYSVFAGNFGDVTYTFNAADASAAVLISYSFTPAALEQAVLEWIGERYRYKDRIGQTSKSLGGSETAAYSLKGIPDYVDVVLAGYRKFLPVQAMFTVAVNDHAVQAWLTAMPDHLRADLESAVYTLAEKLRSHVISDKLMGQVLNRRTGRLGQSIQQKVDSTGTGVVGTVYSSGDVPYARIHEYGGRTAAHVIEARNATALAFVMNGRQVFAKRVNHPGSNMPERSFMRSSLADMKDEIIQRMTQAVQDGTKP